MARRSFDDAFWGDTFVQDIEKDAKLLFLYLWTNKRCNSAGLYEITPKTISFETNIPKNDLPALFVILKPKVIWLPDKNIVWVKNFLKHQPKSPQFLKSVADCLHSLNSNSVVNDYLSYYSQQGVSIPYTYPMDTLSIPYRYRTELELELEPELDKELELDIIKNDGDLKKYPADYVEKRKLIFAGLKIRRGYISRQPSAEAKAISQLLEEKFTPEQILQAHDLMKNQRFYQDKPCSMMAVRKNIHEVLKHGTASGKQSTIKHQPDVKILQ